MKNIALALLLITAMTGTVAAQEIVVDSVNIAKFAGLLKGGNMGEVLYMPYFIKGGNDKKNFVIRQIESHSMREEKIVRLELPQSYGLSGSAFNGMAYLLAFYDAGKKENVLLTVSNGNVVKKKTAKAGDKKYIPLSSHEGFILVTVDGKGRYTVENVDLELKTKWEKSFSPPSGSTWDLISVKRKMEGLEIIRKENGAGGKYAFSMHIMQPEDGTDMAQSTIGNEDMNPYPTFISEKEGMIFTGGYFFKNGTYSKQPDGVFMGLLGLDGNLNDVAKVPFSQVIEALKSTLGGKLASGDASIIFSSGTMLHETQTFVMTGQLVSRKQKENSCVLTLDEFVTIKIGFDGTFKDASVIKTTAEQITLEGDTKNTNTLDLGIWLNNAGLSHFKYYAHMTGNPIMSYVTIDENGVSNLCFRNVGLANDTLDPICMPLNREPSKATPYTFTGTATPPSVVNFNSVIVEEPLAMSYTTYGMISDGHLTLRKAPLQSLEKLEVMIMPEDPPMDEPHEEEPPIDEEPPADEPPAEEAAPEQ